MDFSTKFFLKNLADDLKYSTTSITARDMSVKIKKAAYSNDGIKEICSLMRYAISSAATDIYDCVVKYANFKNIDINSKPISEIYGDIITEIKNMYLEEKYSDSYINSIVSCLAIDQIVRNIKMFINKCDDIINFIQYTYRIEAQKDERFEKISLKAMLDIYSGMNSCMWTEDIMPNEQQKKESYIDNNKLSPEYGKIVCKRIRAMKADILSATNKYFGKNSKLASFNIMDIVL